MKYIYSVPDMSCGHCTTHIEEALREWGKASSFIVELEQKRVTVESSEPSDAIVRIISDVGYTPSLV